MRASSESSSDEASSTSAATRKSSPNASLWGWLVSESTRMDQGVRHAPSVNSSIAPSVSRVNTEPVFGAMAISAILDGV